MSRADVLPSPNFVLRSLAIDVSRRKTFELIFVSGQPNRSMHSLDSAAVACPATPRPNAINTAVKANASCARKQNLDVIVRLNKNRFSDDTFQNGPSINSTPVPFTFG